METKTAKTRKNFSTISETETAAQNDVPIGTLVTSSADLTFRETGLVIEWLMLGHGGAVRVLWSDGAITSEWADGLRVIDETWE